MTVSLIYIIKPQPMGPNGADMVLELWIFEEAVCQTSVAHILVIYCCLSVEDPCALGPMRPWPGKEREGGGGGV